jgi:hypothetical protein
VSVQLLIVGVDLVGVHSILQCGGAFFIWTASLTWRATGWRTITSIDDRFWQRRLLAHWDVHRNCGLLTSTMRSSGASRKTASRIVRESYSLAVEVKARLNRR